MKKLFLVLTASLAFGALPVFADGDGSGNRFDVHADLFPLLLEEFSVGGEAVLPIKDVSIVADVQYSPNYFWVSNIQLFDFSARVRYYWGDLLTTAFPPEFSFLKRGALAGLFSGIGGGYNSLSESWGGYTWTASSLSVYLETGTKFFFDHHFYTEAVIGLDIQTATSWSVSGGGQSVSYGGYNYSPGWLYGDLSFGYAF